MNFLIRQLEGEAEAYQRRITDLSGANTALKLRPITIFTAAIHAHNGVYHSRDCGAVNNRKNRPFVLGTCPHCAVLDGVG